MVKYVLDKDVKKKLKKSPAKYQFRLDGANPSQLNGKAQKIH